MDAAGPVHQLPAVPGAPDWLNKEQDSEPAEKTAEDRGRHNHQWRHHDEPQDDEGGAAVVIEVAADGGRSVEDLRGTNARVRSYTPKKRERTNR